MELITDFGTDMISATENENFPGQIRYAGTDADNQRNGVIESQIAHNLVQSREWQQDENEGLPLPPVVIENPYAQPLSLIPDMRVEWDKLEEYEGEKLVQICKGLREENDRLRKVMRVAVQQMILYQNQKEKMQELFEKTSDANLMSTRGINAQKGRPSNAKRRQNGPQLEAIAQGNRF